MMPDGGRPPRTLAQGLFDFAVNHPVASVPPEVLRAACFRVVDTVSAALASASLGLGMAATRAVLAEPAGGGSASVWASRGGKRPAADAVMANGMLSHGVDYDDTHSRALIHTGGVIVPTALAVGEEVGATGPQVTAAVAIGYEIANRLGCLVPGRFQKKGFHPSSALGIFGATATAARLMGLSTDRSVCAAGLAGSMASGLMEYLADGSDAKQMHPGWAAHGAVLAIQLARHGATGPATVLEGRSGVFRAFVDADVDVDEALFGLGRRWDGLSVATKPYPACHSLHASVDAWREIRDAEALTGDDVREIRRLTATVPAAYPPLICDPIEQKRRPRTVYEARFSLPYALACVVVDGRLTLDSFREHRLADERLLDLAQRVDYQVVEYAEYPDLGFPGGLRVELADGRTFEAHVRHNAGSVHNPLSEEAICAKFLDAAGRCGTDAAATSLLAALRTLPDSHSLERFTTAMSQFGAS